VYLRHESVFIEDNEELSQSLDTTLPSTAIIASRSRSRSTDRTSNLYSDTDTGVTETCTTTNTTQTLQSGSNGGTTPRSYKRSGASISNFRRGEGSLRATVSNEDVRTTSIHSQNLSLRRSQKAASPVDSGDDTSIDEPLRAESIEESGEKKRDRSGRRPHMRSKLKKSLSMVVPRETQMQGRPVSTSSAHSARPAESDSEEGRKRTIST